MTTTLEMLEAEVMKLSAADRSRLLEKLLASLDEDDEVEAAWDAIADEREFQASNTSTEAVAFEQAFARLEIGTPRTRGRRFFPTRVFPYGLICRPLLDGIYVRVVRRHRRRPNFGEGRYE